MRRVLVISAIILIIRPLLRWGFRFAATARNRVIEYMASRAVFAIVDASRVSIAASRVMKRWVTRWYANEPDTSPWTSLRCGACRGIGDTHMCEIALWRCGTCPVIIPGNTADVRIREHEQWHKEAA